MAPPERDVLKNCHAYPGQVADRAARPAKGAAGTTLGRGVLHQQAAASQFDLTRDFTATIDVPPARYVTFAATAPQIPEPKP